MMTYAVRNEGLKLCELLQTHIPVKGSAGPIKDKTSLVD